MMHQDSLLLLWMDHHCCCCCWRAHDRHTHYMRRRQKVSHTGSVGSIRGQKAWLSNNWGSQGRTVVAVGCALSARFYVVVVVLSACVLWRWWITKRRPRHAFTKPVLTRDVCKQVGVCHFLVLAATHLLVLIHVHSHPQTPVIPLRRVPDDIGRRDNDLLLLIAAVAASF